MIRLPRRLLALSVLVFGLAVAAAPALADEHNSHVSGHPLRIAAYVLHPFGVIIDTLIFRPAHWFVSFEPVKTLFGHQDYDD